jgi:hypothetical protein
MHVDFHALYGPNWAFLNSATPSSAMFAVGSPVTVGWPQLI